MDNTTASKRMVDILGIDTAFPTSSFKKVVSHRFCQLIMRARLAQGKEHTQIKKREA